MQIQQLLNMCVCNRLQNLYRKQEGERGNQKVIEIHLHPRRIWRIGQGYDYEGGSLCEGVKLWQKDRERKKTKESR